MKAPFWSISPLLPLLLLRPSRCVARDDSDPGCEISPARPAEAFVPPTWQASFPGSGSRMTRFLMEALTGVSAKSIGEFITSLGGIGGMDDRRSRFIAVKTHYPVNTPAMFEQVDHLFDRALVIFRNPLNAIPSLFNQQYERWHKLPTHSVRAPQENWVNWRDLDQGLPLQIAQFEAFTEYWMERWPRNERHDHLLLVSYEDLTDPMNGPVAAGRIAEFLGGRVEGVDPVPPEAVPCVWDAVVNFKKDGGQGGRRLDVNVNPNSLRTGPKVRPYTEQDLDRIAAMLRRLLEKYGDDEYFAQIFSSYLEAVLNTPAGEGFEVNNADPGPSTSGPEVRPYTQQDLDKIAAMLRGLLEKYGNDEYYARTFSSYLEIVLNTPAGEGI